MNNWMMKCEEVSKLVSQSLDRKLPLHQRIGIRLHLMMCKLCTQNYRQLLDLRQTFHLFMKETDKIEPPEILPPEKKAEIKKEIRRISDSQ
jgi:predicted anti-sigma-YlaC factor YlaD